MIPFKSLIFCFGVISILHLVVAYVQKLPPPGSHNLLAFDLFFNTVNKRTSENVLFSPIAIESALTLALAGAEGKTADDIRKFLKLEGDKKRITQNLHEFLAPIYGYAKTDGPELYLANHLYASADLNILPAFNKIAEQELYTQSENINFKEGKVCIKRINKFIQEETHNKIKNLLSDEDITDETQALLVNAMYFKGKFKYPFNKYDTKSSEFYFNNGEKKLVDLMRVQGKFNFAYLPELEATALELPFNNTDLSFVIVLPKSSDNLEKFQTKFKTFEFNYIPSRFVPTNVCAYVPKFRVEYKLDMQPILKSIGLSNLFSEKAEFGGIFDSPEKQHITGIKHKSFLEIDEGDIDAGSYSGPSRQCESGSILFNVDHPFIFGVRSNSAVYFAGHVAKI
ncbi:serine protease inhibitor 42Dd-like [Cochliomyia hominivorax]